MWAQLASLPSSACGARLLTGPSTHSQGPGARGTWLEAAHTCVCSDIRWTTVCASSSVLCGPCIRPPLTVQICYWPDGLGAHTDTRLPVLLLRG